MNKKEKFRMFAIGKGFNNRIFIDSSSFVHFSNVAGCFFDSGMWAVYETDSVGEANNIKFYKDEDMAYFDLARRFGYAYQP